MGKCYGHNDTIPEQKRPIVCIVFWKDLESISKDPWIMAKCRVFWHIPKGYKMLRWPFVIGGCQRAIYNQIVAEDLAGTVKMQASNNFIGNPANTFSIKSV